MTIKTKIFIGIFIGIGFAVVLLFALGLTKKAEKGTEITEFPLGALATGSRMAWELRASATAGNLNGGGFNSGNATPGTDYSQQDAAQDSGTDLASADGIPASGGCIITSATHDFVDADEGNIIHITETGTGFTVGWYEIVSTATNAATLDRACGADGALTGGDWYLGGAMSLGSTLDDDFFEVILAGNKIWVKNGSYTLGEAVAIAAAGGALAPITIEGYNATRGDKPTGTSRPTIAGAANAFTLGANWEEYNIIHTGTAATVVTGGTNSKFVNVKITNTSSTANRIALGGVANNLVFNSELVSYRGPAFDTIATFFMVGNYIHDSNYGVLFRGGTGAYIIVDNVVENNVTAAVSVRTTAATGGIYILNNTLYGAENKLGQGITLSLVAGGSQATAINNIIYGFVTGAVGSDAAQSASFDNYNNYYNNTADTSNWMKGANDQAVDPGFTSVSQVTGTTGAFVAGGSKLVDTSKNFTTSGVTAGQTVYIKSGTGITAGLYLIDSISTTTNPNDTLDITIPASPGTNTTADKTYQITLGHNFAIGTNLKGLGFPGAFQGGFSTGYMDIGAAQRQEPTGGGGGGTVGCDIIMSCF